MPTSSILIFAGMFAVVLAAALACVVSRATRRRDEGSSIASLCEIDVDRYLPMSRLLCEEDMEFLREQAGYTADVEVRLKAERRAIMRQYLRDLSRDFGRVHGAAIELLMMSPEEQPELANELVRQKAIFYRGLAGVHVQVLLHAAIGREVRVDNLVGALSALHSRTFQVSQSLIAVPQMG